MPKLIVGCGYVGSRLARCWAERGESVWVTSRSQQRLDTFHKEGLRGLLLDVTQANRASLPDVDTAVFAVGYDRCSPHSMHEVYAEGLRGVLDRLGPSLRRFIYLSSTGVYGQHEGEWVDEESACVPIRDGGQACLSAESALRRHPLLGPRSIILRLAGIYGPGRLLQLERVRQGKPLRVAANAALNLVHVDDVVRVIIAAGEQAVTPLTLCVSDGVPVSRRDFYRYLAQRLKVKPPVFEPPPDGSPQAERARGNKKIRNNRLVAELGFQFRYPNYRDGLAAVLAAGTVDSWSSS